MSEIDSEINYVYILSEDDNDDLFYQGCLNKITGKTYHLIQRKPRRGGGIPNVRNQLPILLNEIQYSGHVASTWFIIALDNDRSPIHPDHAKPADWSKLSKEDQKKPCRYCELEKVVVEKLGSDRSSWPIRGAIAVPVQMLETWLLLIANPDHYGHEDKLPIFAGKTSASAKTYYQSNPPEQLKDLKTRERERLSIPSNSDFCKYCADQLDPLQLSQISPSFQRFMDEVLSWDKQ